jgi:hypothetical protein
MIMIFVEALVEGILWKIEGDPEVDVTSPVFRYDYLLEDLEGS